MCHQLLFLYPQLAFPSKFYSINHQLEYTLQGNILGPREYGESGRKQNKITPDLLELIEQEGR